MTKERTLAAVFAAVLLGPSQLAAADESLLPRAETIGGIVFMSGGIGTGERDAMRAHAANYNLRLAFVAAGRGAYLGGAKVRIEDDQGRTILEADARGPWFYARLANARYRVIATHDAGEISREVNLTKRDADLVLRWPVAIDN